MKELHITLKNGARESVATYYLHDLDRLGFYDLGKFTHMVITNLEAAHTRNEMLDKFVSECKAAEPRETSYDRSRGQWPSEGEDVPLKT